MKENKNLVKNVTMSIDPVKEYIKENIRLGINMTIIIEGTKLVKKIVFFFDRNSRLPLLKDLELILKTGKKVKDVESELLFLVEADNIKIKEKRI